MCTFFLKYIEYEYIYTLNIMRLDINMNKYIPFLFSVSLCLISSLLVHICASPCMLGTNASFHVTSCERIYVHTLMSLRTFTFVDMCCIIYFCHYNYFIIDSICSRFRLQKNEIVENIFLGSTTFSWFLVCFHYLLSISNIL